MTLQTWLLFCATETVLCFTPGPAVLLVMSTSLTRGARRGLAASFGILVANVFYFLLSATTIGTVLLASWQLFFLVKWVGAAYLIWLGTRMLLSPSRATDPPLATADRRPGSASSFALGIVTQGANPKALVFFTALLPQFISPEIRVPLQVAILGVSSVLIELTVLVLYVASCHSAREVVGRGKLGAMLQRAGGVLLIGAGARLAAVRR